MFYLLSIFFLDISAEQADDALVKGPQSTRAEMSKPFFIEGGILKCICVGSEVVIVPLFRLGTLEGSSVSHERN